MIDTPVAGARLVLSLGVLIAIPLLALNLRPAVTSVGAMLTDIESGMGMSTVLASAVVAAPVWCFALGGALAWAMRSRLGTSRTVSLALAALAATLAARVLGGPILLLGGTVVACLAIAVLGTLLPVITHAAPARAWALLTGCYVAAMGGGSGVGALITPQVAGHSSWQLGVSGWALLAVAAWAAWRVASRRFSEPPVRARKHPGPSSLAPASTAWSLTLHFGLTSGFTFSIMGWLPSILLDYAHVPPGRAEWMFTLAMALGVPIALMVPKWARATKSQSGLAVALASPSLLATVGLLMLPTWSPWLWAIGLGLGMPAVGLALALISMRAASDTDTAAALSSMVQGIGYAIAGVTALACGLLHSSTKAWEWPLLGLLVILCGQIVAGMHAGLPITVHAGGRPEQRLLRASRLALPPARRAAEPYPDSPVLGIPRPRNGAASIPEMAPAMRGPAPVNAMAGPPANRPVPTGEMAAYVNSMAPAGQMSAVMNAVPQYLLGAPGRPRTPGPWHGPPRPPMPRPAPPYGPVPPPHGPDRPPAQRRGPDASPAIRSAAPTDVVVPASSRGPDARSANGSVAEPTDVLVPKQRRGSDVSSALESAAPTDVLIPSQRRGPDATPAIGSVAPTDVVVPARRRGPDATPAIGSVAPTDVVVPGRRGGPDVPSALGSVSPTDVVVPKQRRGPDATPAIGSVAPTDVVIPAQRRGSDQSPAIGSIASTDVVVPARRGGSDESPANGSVAAPAEGLVHGPAIGSVAPTDVVIPAQRRGSDASSGNGAVAPAEQGPVHGPELPPLHGPELPPVHGPFPSPDREDVPAVPVQRATLDEQPAIADDSAVMTFLPHPRRGEAPVSPSHGETQPNGQPDTALDTAPEAPEGTETLIPSPRRADASEECEHPVQLELALVLEPQSEPRSELRSEPQSQPQSQPRPAPDPEVFVDRTTFIPHPRKPRW